MPCGCRRNLKAPTVCRNSTNQLSPNQQRCNVSLQFVKLQVKRGAPSVRLLQYCCAPTTKFPCCTSFFFDSKGCDTRFKLHAVKSYCAIWTSSPVPKSKKGINKLIPALRPWRLARRASLARAVRPGKRGKPCASSATPRHNSEPNFKVKSWAYCICPPQIHPWVFGVLIL